MKKQKLTPEEKQEIRKSNKSFNEMVRRLKKKDALVELDGKPL